MTAPSDVLEKNFTLDYKQHDIPVEDAYRPQVANRAKILAREPSLDATRFAVLGWSPRS